MTGPIPPAGYRALHAATNGIVRQIVQLHQPTTDGWQICTGCNPDCDAAECWTVWPCPTTRLIAERLGVSLRDQDYTVDGSTAPAPPALPS